MKITRKTHEQGHFQKVHIAKWESQALCLVFENHLTHVAGDHVGGAVETLGSKRVMEVAKRSDRGGRVCRTAGVDSWSCGLDLQAWGEAQGVENSSNLSLKVLMLADTTAELSRALGVANTKYISKLGNVRCDRFAMLVDDNTVVKMNVSVALHYC